jgi:hypothetical protein
MRTRKGGGGGGEGGRPTIVPPSDRRGRWDALVDRRNAMDAQQRIRTLRRIRVRRHCRGYSRVGVGTTTSAASAAAAVGTTIDDGRGSHRCIPCPSHPPRHRRCRRCPGYEVSAVVIDVDFKIGRRCQGSKLKRALDETRARQNSTEEGQGQGTETHDIWIGRPAGIGDDGTIDRRWYD